MNNQNILELDKLSSYQENNQIEAKSAQGGLPDSLWDSYSAFANTDGGCILLGVKERDDHSLYAVGLKDATKLVKDFWNMINNRQKISVNLMTEHRVRVETVDGKQIIVLEVPRAERTTRPVYKGMDPRTGTYRRNGEGDYPCSIEEVSAMFRDAALTPQDAKVLKEMDKSVFCQDTINSYRRIFQNLHPNHVWNQLEDEVFLRRIGAMAVGEDGAFHPTVAGLLVFGYEYEITREFPQYFLDYQENRQMSTTRWTDRVVSSSGDWSGNLFDYVLKVLPKLTANLKIPFVLKGGQRIDDTPIHKILREAITNACAHADFYGRRGLVISKSDGGFTFANPGSMRLDKKIAIGGGISDPRNGTILKIFSLINYGERAGSGLNSIFYVWEHVYHTPAVITEEVGVDRVIVELPTGGHEQDMKAMLELYDNPEELTFPHDGDMINGQNDRNDGQDVRQNEKLTDKSALMANLADKLSDKKAVWPSIIDKLADILIFAQQKEYVLSSEIESLVDVSDRTARRYLNVLADAGFLKADGGNKNKKYRYIG